MPGRPILIVGGGPAGASLAAALAGAGRPVVLLEKRDDDEGKCCGSCLAPRAIASLRRLRLEETVRSIPMTATRRWRLHDAAGRVLLDESLGAEPGLMVDRARMDAALRRRAAELGATIRCGAPWTRVRLELEPALVVGADGVGSGVARAFGLAGSAASGELDGARGPWRVGRRRPAPRRYGVSWSLPLPADDAACVPPESIEIHLAAGGYLGLVRDDRRLVAAALIDRERTRGTASPSAVLDEWLDGSPSLRPLRDALRVGASRGGALRSGAAREVAPRQARGAASALLATGPLPWRPALIALAPGEAAPEAPGVALVGDAAGYEEPFTGEGMAWAFESAELLARCILERDRWDAAAAARYAREHRALFEPRRRRLRAIGALGSMLSRRPAMATLLRLGGSIPGIPGAVVRSVVAA